MAGKAMSVKQAAQIAEQIAQKQNVELIDVELVKEPTGHFLRFYIDKPDGIALDELEKFHREIQPLVENVAYDYMEVSSPGADRPLKTEKDFARAQGEDVELKTYKAVGGVKEFRGVLVGLIDGMVVVDVDGVERMSFPQRDVAVVRPLIEFTEEDLQDDV